MFNWLKLIFLWIWNPRGNSRPSEKKARDAYWEGFKDARNQIERQAREEQRAHKNVSKAEFKIKHLRSETKDCICPNCKKDPNNQGHVYGYRALAVDESLIPGARGPIEVSAQDWIEDILYALGHSGDGQLIRISVDTIER